MTKLKKSVVTTFIASALIAACFACGAAGTIAVRADAPAASAEAPALPTAISPTDPRIHYAGRFAPSPAGPQCAWPASSATVRFYGSALNVKLRESGASDEFQVFVDGVPKAVLVPSAGEHVYRLLTSQTPAVHVVDLVKRTESFFGTSTFEGFQLSTPGRFGRVAPHARKIEVIGDSISCGYGDEAPNQQVHFSSKTENAAMAYGAVAARDLDADYVCAAWSGKLMWPKNTLPEIYGRTIPTDASSVWDFSAWTPDVVVINLSTNDFAGGIPDQAGWTGAYEAFIKRVRGLYPKAEIYCAMSPMLYGKAYDTLKSYLTQICSDETAAGDAHVRLLMLPTQDPNKGFGADWHPNLVNQQRTAQVMEATIESDLGWKPATSSAPSLSATDLLALPIISLASGNGN